MELKSDITIPLTHFIPDAISVLEQARDWRPNLPRLDLNLSNDPSLRWERPGPVMSLHKSSLFSRSQVILFGQNHLIDFEGAWSCEAQSSPNQYLNFYSADFYNHFYPGSKPVLRLNSSGNTYELEIKENISNSIIDISQPVFLATPLEPDNWGRWITTVLTKVRYFKKLGLLSNVKFLCRYASLWQKNLLSFMGLSAEEILIHDPGRIYHCQSIYSIDYSAADFAVTELEKAIFAEIVLRCGGRVDSSPEKIYVARINQSKKSPHYRVLDNEFELASELVDRGFVVVQPELLTFEEQVRVFYNARVIVGLGGSGMFNTIFCKPGTAVVDIESGTHFVSDHARLFASIGLDYSIIFGTPRTNDPTLIHKRWDLDLRRALSAIESVI